MCKIGILAIGIDLYLSAFQHFQTLLILLQQLQQQQHPHEHGSRQQYHAMMDLAAHFLALMTLVQAFRGRVNRQATGRIVFPVLAVKAVLELDALQQRGVLGGYNYHLKDILEVAKSLVFLIITFKLAFGKDKSYVAYDEWFPTSNTCQHDPRSCAVVDDDDSEEEEGANEKKTK